MVGWSVNTQDMGRFSMAPGEDEAEFSDWMSQLPAELHDVPLWHLALPGMNLNLCFGIVMETTYQVCVRLCLRTQGATIQ